MAIGTTPTYLQNSSHSASIFRVAQSAPFASGGILASSELPVSQQSTPNMSVILGPGRAQIPGTSVSAPSGQNWTTQAMYTAINDANVSLTVTTSDPTQPRIDAVYIQIQDSYYSGAANTAIAGIVAGTPGASPTPPATPSNSLLTAYIAVGANVTSIVNANITYEAPAAKLIPSGQGLVPVVPASVSAGATLGPNGSISFAGASSVTVNGCFTAAFAAYRIITDIYGMGTPGTLALQLAIAGVASAGTNYDETISYQSSSSTSAPAATAAASNWTITPGSAGSHTVVIDLQNPAIATLTRGVVNSVDYNGASAPVVAIAALGHRAASAFDGLVLSVLSGAGMVGTVRIYGYNNE